MALPARFRKARKQAGLTRMAVAQQAGCGQTVALEIENRHRLPSVATLVRLATALNVSASWLAYGIGEASGSDQPPESSEMSKRLRQTLHQKRMSRAELGRLTGISPRAIAKVESGGQSGIDVVESLAKALGVSPGWLAFGVGPQVPVTPRRGRPPAQPSARSVDC